MDFTTRLLLNKPNPDPVTGDVVDVAKLNQNFDKIDANISATPCTSGTRPATPFQGQIIAETDTNRAYVRIGSTWVQLIGTGGTIVGQAIYETQLEVNRPAPRIAVDHAFRTKLAADAQYRYLMQVDGKMFWGDGVTAGDTNLYRRQANHLGTDDSFQAGGFCSGAATESVRTSFVSGITTEQVIQSVTFDAVSGAGYMIYACQHYQSSVVNDIMRIRLRYASGLSVTTGGTQLHMLNPNCDAINRGQPITFAKLFVAPSTGKYTIGVTMERVGTGTGQSYGEPTQAINTITVVGA